MPSLQDAIDLAAEAHLGQLDKADRPYILHPLRVMRNVKGGAAKMVAVLHDLIEDTHLTLDDLRKRDYPPEVVEAVDCLTKREGESYNQFIRRLAANALATRVKVADLEDNLDIRRLDTPLDSEDVERLNRYLSAREVLREPPSCHLLRKRKLTKDDIRRLARVEQILTSSHFDMGVRACPRCEQLYLECRAEVIRYQFGGEDDNWSFFTPVSEGDLDELRRNHPCALEVIDSRRHITWHPDGRIFWTKRREIALQFAEL